MKTICRRTLQTGLASMIALLFLVANSAHSGEDSGKKEDSPLSAFSKEELAKLSKGEPIYQHVKKENKKGEIEGYGQSIIIINKPVEKCFQVFCKFDKHHLYFPRKKKSEVVKSWDNKALVHKVFGFYVVDVEYTVLYTVDPEKRRVDYKLDKDYPHDLKEVEGFFKFEKIDENRTLFTYAATKVETGLKVPGFIQDYLTSKDLPQVANSVKKRIESGEKWEK